MIIINKGNLDPESAYYDPKSRTMREAPEANVMPEDVCFFVFSIIMIYSQGKSGHFCGRQLSENVGGRSGYAKAAIVCVRSIPYASYTSPLIPYK